MLAYCPISRSQNGTIKSTCCVMMGCHTCDRVFEGPDLGGTHLWKDQCEHTHAHVGFLQLHKLKHIKLKLLMSQMCWIKHSAKPYPEVKPTKWSAYQCSYKYLLPLNSQQQDSHSAKSVCFCLTSTCSHFLNMHTVKRQSIVWKCHDSIITLWPFVWLYAQVTLENPHWRLSVEVI